MGKAVAISEEMVLADFGRLSRPRKREAADFIAFLRVKEELEATKEIISDKDFMQSIMKGDEDFKAGRVKKWSAAEKKFAEVWKEEKDGIWESYL